MLGLETVGGDFITWGKPYDAILAREHFEKRIIRYAHVVGDEGAGFAGASLLDAFYILRHDELQAPIEETWKQLVSFTGWSGTFRGRDYRRELFIKVARLCNQMDEKIDGHMVQGAVA